MKGDAAILILEEVEFRFKILNMTILISKNHIHSTYMNYNDLCNMIKKKEINLYNKNIHEK
jgi:uncharacterized protein YfkK (UPF0435 family)